MEAGWTEENLEQNLWTSARPVVHPQTLLTVEVEGAERVQPGTDLRCRLTVATNRPIKILSSEVRFVCRGHCVRYHRSSRVGWLTSTRVDVLEDEGYCSISTTHPPDDRHDPAPHVPEAPGDVVLHGGPDNIHIMSSSSLWMKLELPDDLPDSWSYYNRRLSSYRGRVTSFVQARVTYCRLDPRGTPDKENKVLRAEQGVTVMNRQVPVEQFGNHGVASNETEARVGFFGTRGRITCVLTAHDHLGVLGSDLPLEVLILNNSARTLHKVSLTLFKELTFRGSQSGDHFHFVQREKLVKTRLPRIGPRRDWHREITHFAIPEDCLTSASLLPCSFVTLRFFVMVKIRWWWGSLRCPLDVFLGTEAERTLPPPDNGVPRYDLVRPVNWLI